MVDEIKEPIKIEEVKEKIAEDTAKVQEPKEIELMAKLDSRGQLVWTIPQDIRIAIYLLKHLDVVISRVHATNLSQAMHEESKKQIVKPGMFNFLRKK